MTVLAPNAATAVVLAAAADVGVIGASGRPALVVADDGGHRHFGGVEAYLRQG